MKLVVTENITLDGVIEATEGWFTPADGDGVDTSDMLAVTREQMRNESAILLGRVTFEEFRGYWARQTDDSTGITDFLNRVPKYVVSRSLSDPAWENSTVLSADPIAEVRKLKEMPGNDLGVTGSITLVRALIDAGLVDEYRLFVYPVVIGRGRRMFVDGIDRRNLRLVEAAQFNSGVVLMTYRLGS